MQRKNALASLIKIVSCSLLVLGTVAQAADEKKSDPTGVWTWTQPGRQGGADRTNTLTLKMDGDKVTGKLSTPGRGGQSMDADIKDAKLAGDDLSFSVTREFNGNSITTKYTGKVSGDTIKGSTEFDRNGEPVKRDWEAKRKK